MNHYVRGQSTATTGPQFEYFRDWVPYDTDPSKAGKAIAAAYKQSSIGLVDADEHPLLHRQRRPDRRPRARWSPGSASYANASAAPTSYSETSGVEGDTVNNQPSDAPGTFAAFTSPALKAPG